MIRNLNKFLLSGVLDSEARGRLAWCEDTECGVTETESFRHADTFNADAKIRTRRAGCGVLLLTYFLFFILFRLSSIIKFSIAPFNDCIRFIFSNATPSILM